MSRYLTPEEKQSELAWQAQSREGEIDLAIVPELHRINRLPGIVVTQGYAGGIHDGLVLAGHIWLRVNQATSQRFRDRAFELTCHPLIEHAGILFTGIGQEVVEIVFKGEAHGRLRVSMAVITEFLEVVAANQEDAS